MKANEASTFESCAMPHFEALLRFARRLTRREHLAEDLVQETLLKAYKAFNRLELREFGIKPWLMRILHNTYLTRSMREQRAPQAADLSIVAADLATPNDGGLPALPALDPQRLDDDVKRALDELAEEFRSVLLLWATMEYSYHEIGVILEIPIGTVMSRLHRARQALATRLRHHDLARPTAKETRRA